MKVRVTLNSMNPLELQSVTAISAYSVNWLLTSTNKNPSYIFLIQNSGSFKADFFLNKYLQIFLVQ